ncbi:MAG: hypothetical protein LZF62_310147 [Nitrospira sp.]|nr:MAG: hypothetical protein LZF62_310147 [Nitrospira sp.]
MAAMMLLPIIFSSMNSDPGLPAHQYVYEMPVLPPCPQKRDRTDSLVGSKSRYSVGSPLVYLSPSLELGDQRSALEITGLVLTRRPAYKKAILSSPPLHDALHGGHQPREGGYERSYVLIVFPCPFARFFLLRYPEEVMVH